MFRYWLDDNWPLVCIAGLIAFLIFAFVQVGHERAAERAEIDTKCGSYLNASETRRDSLQARMACDQLRASYDAKTAAEDAQMAAGVAAGAASSPR